MQQVKTLGHWVRMVSQVSTETISCGHDYFTQAIAHVDSIIFDKQYLCVITG